MNIKFIDDLTFNIYIRKDEIKKIDINNREELEKYLKDIISKIKKIYNITIVGFYNINVYVDEYYGLIINFNKEKIDYYDYFNGLEMNINIKNVSFLYEVYDIPFDLLKKVEVKRKDNNLYLKIIKELDKKEFMNLMEHTEKIVELC